MSVCAIMSRLNLCFKEYLNELKDRSWRYNVLRPSAMFIKAKWLIPFENISMYHLQVHKKDLFEMVKSSGQEVFFVHIYDLIRISNIRFLTYKCNYAHMCEFAIQWIIIFVHILFHMSLHWIEPSCKYSKKWSKYSPFIFNAYASDLFFLSFIMLLYLYGRISYIKAFVVTSCHQKRNFFFSFNIVQ